MALIALLLAVLTMLTFSPGFMSYDSLFQLDQALGREPLSDWHPPVMSLLWTGLMKVTGTYAVMAALQIGVLWAVLFVIAMVVLRVSGSPRWALAFLALGLMPQVLNIVGVVWKDVQMALALLAVVAIAMVGHAARQPRRLRWVLFPLGILLLVYALLVRKNGIVAILPLLYLLYRSWFPPGRRAVLAGSVVAFAAAAFLAQTVITVAASPLPTAQFSAIAIDDVIHVVPRDELRRADLSKDLKDKLLAAQALCEKKNSLMNAYWTCYGRGAEGPFTPIADHEELTRAWPRLMAQRPAGYLQYRAEVYAQFLFNNRDYWQEGVLGNEKGITVDHPRMVSSLRTYILQFANRNVMFLFGAWFWLGVAVVQSTRWRRASRFGLLVPCIGVSSLLYILAYIPTAPATDYRYVYWPAIGGSLALMVMALDRWSPARDHSDAAYQLERTRPSGR
jgi:hypothetical protein